MDHSNRVRHLSRLLAQRIGFSGDQLESLAYAATLHDIGKIAIGTYMINKSTSLTQIEESMMRQHTVWGHKLIRSLLSDPMIWDVVLYHHENYDGSGYPMGLKGEKIPLAARIVRITDSYDAMTNARPYRTASSSAQAIKLLEADCRYFDPVLLKEFLTLLANVHFQRESLRQKTFDPS